MDVVHAAEVGLGSASDAALLERAIDEGRIVVTRNVRHFAPLAKALARKGRPFPGILFVSPVIRQGDAGVLVQAVEDWVARHGDENPVAGTYGWLPLAGSRD